MAVLIERLTGPVAMDTLPVIKLTHWYGTPARDEIYAYARLCLCPEGLRIRMTVFDREPAPTEKITALLQMKRSLRLEFTRDTACLTAGSEAYGLPQTVFSAGADEQGWYWQADCLLQRELMARAGAEMPADGVAFDAAFFLRDTREEAFGSAFACPAGESPVPERCLGQLIPFPCG